jgi:hypothetical protein
MAKLTFEVWRNEDDNSLALCGVTREGDRLRAAISPRSKLVHSFTAETDFEASQKYYDWNGWGEWKKPDFAEHYFTDQEAQEQRRYMAERSVG